MATESVLSHPFFALALSLRPPSPPASLRTHPELLPSSPLLQTFHLAEPQDKSNWPVCPKCERPFHTELALRHHLASQFHRHTEEEKQSPNLLLEPEDEEVVVVPEEKAPADQWVCSKCTADKVFGSALALRMHEASRSHTQNRDIVHRSPTQEAPWEKPIWTPPLVEEVPEMASKNAGGVEEALKRICAEIAATKRVTFSDSMLSEVDIDGGTQILVLSATRDLALLVHTVLTPRCAAFGITTYACVGGTVVRDDQRALQQRPHIISGTPGRVADLINRRSLNKDSIRTLVLNKEEMLLSRSMWPHLAAVYGLLDLETRVVRASVRVK